MSSTRVSHWNCAGSDTMEQSRDIIEPSEEFSGDDGLIVTGSSLDVSVVREGLCWKGLANSLRTDKWKPKKP